MAGALDGITILDLAEGTAGALATMLLCDHGARVIRIDPPGADDAAREPAYRVWHRGKQSVALDLAAALSAVSGAGAGTVPAEHGPPRQLLLFDSLVRRADVLVESFAPGSDYQLLAGYERLRGVNPRLVHCSITAYGRKGPLRDEPPLDDLVMARTGLLTESPSAIRSGPVHVAHPIPSAGAALLAAEAVVAALLVRERSGMGMAVETSLMAGVLAINPKVAGERLPVTNPTIAGGAFYSLHECAAAAMGISERIAGPRFGGGHSPVDAQTHQELIGIVDGVIRSKPFDEWARIFEESDVPHARACTAEEAMDDPQVRSNDTAIQIDDPEVGTVVQMGVPIKLSKTPGGVRGPAPRRGEHTEQVMSEISDPKHSTLHRRQASPDEATAPLSGIRVLEVGNVIAGPAVGKHLADLGADVVKLEPLEGDFSRPKLPAYFVHVNSCKRSVSVNTRTPEGREVLRRLAARADVLVSNLRPGATDRMGIGTAALGSLNPRIIETHVTGFGAGGPYAHRPGLDPLAQAITGLLRAQGGYEGPPVFLKRLAPTDFAAGALGALGVLLALFVRERTGISQRVDTSLLDAAALLNADGFMRYAGKPRRRLAGREQLGLGPLHRLYDTADGWVYLAAEAPEQWGPLCAALDRPDLLADGRFMSRRAAEANGEALASELATALRSHTNAQVVVRLSAAGVPCAPVVEAYDRGFFSDPQAQANDMITEREHVVYGRMKFSDGLIKFTGAGRGGSGPTPLLGEHTAEVLSSVGYSSQETGGLYEKGVIKTERPAMSSPVR